MNLNKTDISKKNAKLASFYLSKGGNGLPHYMTMNPIRMKSIFNDLVPIIQPKHPELASKVERAIEEIS